MAVCSVAGCNNRFRKGVKMYRFPCDPRRRKCWANKLKRKDWYPSDTSRICEVHFEEDQYENHRLDGVRKLKPNAVPTIFPRLFGPPCRRKPPKNPQPIYPVKNTVLVDHTYHKTRGLKYKVGALPREEPQLYPDFEGECSTQTTVLPVEAMQREESTSLPSHYTDFTYVGDEVVVFTTYIYPEDEEEQDHTKKHLFLKVNDNQILNMTHNRT